MAKLIVILVLSTLLFTACSSDTTSPSVVPSLQAVLDQQLQRYKLPAIAGVMLNNGTVESVALGVRRLGSASSVTKNDQWHIGSNVKAMSATMIATLVEEGKLSWNTTVAEIFPEFEQSMKPVYRSVTLAMLLHHRGGVLALEKVEDLLMLPQWTGDITKQRREFAKWLLEQESPVAPGTYLYSNGGYVLAAAIAEKVTGLSWETLMVQRLCTPLNITVVWGWPAAKGAQQPWGHMLSAGIYTPFDPDGELQFPEVLIPAGHCSATLYAYARFAQAHLDGLRGASSLLKRETFRWLHTPDGQYAAGWETGTLGGSATSWHEGSDGTFDAMIVLQAERNRAVIVVTNCASEQSLIAINDACVSMMK